MIDLDRALNDATRAVNIEAGRVRAAERDPSGPSFVPSLKPSDRVAAARYFRSINARILELDLRDLAVGLGGCESAIVLRGPSLQAYLRPDADYEHDDAELLGFGDVDRMLCGSGWARDDRVGDRDPARPWPIVRVASDHLTLAVGLADEAADDGLVASLRHGMLLTAHGYSIPQPASVARWRRRIAGIGLPESAAELVVGDAPERGLEPPLEIAGVAIEMHRHVYRPPPQVHDLVSSALEFLGDRELPKAAEVGIGSGAIALAIAKARPDASIQGSDLSPLAVWLARRNARRLGLAERVEIRCGSLLEPFPHLGNAAVLDLIVAHLPFVAKTDGLMGAHGPPGAVYGPGADGLGLVRELIAAARPAIRPGGALILLIGVMAWLDLADHFDSRGFVPAEIPADAPTVGSMALTAIRRD